MVADKLTVTSKTLGSDEAWKWESEGADGYTISPAEKDSVGTEIVLTIKQNTEEDSYDEFLEEYRLRSIIKKYSDFIRYPIKMDVTGQRPKEGTENEFEEYKEEQTVNSMVPIWRKNKSELTEEDYNNFYMEKRYGLTNRSNTCTSARMAQWYIMQSCLSRRTHRLIIIQKSMKKASNCTLTVY